jgi:regulator of protease activity HflC (stomatin/prohibitin superfamily)
MVDNTSADKLGWAWVVANRLLAHIPYFHKQTQLAHLRLSLVVVLFVATISICAVIDLSSYKDPLDDWIGISSFIMVSSICFLTALANGAAFFQSLYKLADGRAARMHWLTLIFGLNYIQGAGEIIRALITLTLPIHLLSGLAGFVGYKYLVASEGKISKNDCEGPVMKAGGPCFLIVYSDTAVVTEQNGCFKRVIGPGFAFVDPFETVREVVDLRPQVRTVDSVDALTKDGIPIQMRLEVEFMIQPGQRPPRRNPLATPYPFRESAVRRAVYNKSIKRTCKQESVYEWRDLVIYRARFELRRLLNGYILDRLIEPEEADARKPLELGDTPRQELQSRLRKQLSTRDEETEIKSAQENGDANHMDAKDIGVTILRVTLGQLRIHAEYTQASDEISKQRIKSWQAEWIKRMTITHAEGEAIDFRLRESARAQAQAEMINAISQGLKSMGANEQLPQVLALRTIEALEKMTLDPWAQVFVPEETLETLRKLHSIYA